MFGVQPTVEILPGRRALGVSRLGNPGSSLLRTAVGLFAVVSCSAICANAQVNVTTYQNDIGRTGQNLNETVLTPSNVNTTSFGKLFSIPVDGQVYAQPLYMSGITVNGATHNVVYIATENDTVYAFDADSNGGSNSSPLWKASMLTAAHGAAAGATTVPSTTVGTDITPQIGITGTPVIDPTTGTLYVVSKTVEGSTYPQRLHALDIATGAEKFGGPVLLTASVPGTGNGSVNGTLTFDSLWENQRPGLLLLNGVVWIGFSSHGDNGPWHGWVLGYNAGTLKQTGAYCTSPNAGGSGIWMSGGGLPADQLDPVNHPYGRMFFPTGNGTYDAVKPYTNSMDYGDSHVALDLSNGVPTVIDEFTTNQQALLNSEDGDVASGGMMVIPTQTSGAFPHLAVQAGKQGYMYLINRDNMGGFNSSADQIVQEQPYVVGINGAWSSPAYWNGNVYWWGRNDYLKSFSLANGLLSTTPTKSNQVLFYPGATPTVSANGNTQGVVWAVDTYGYASNSSAVLWAHNASNVSTPIYSSSKNPTRDAAGVAVKFVVPTVANGKVYVGTSTELDVYGLLNGVTQTATPVFTPGTQSYAGSVSVTITDATPGASIFYTTNGTTPTASSTLYTGPINVTTSQTIKAIASATGFLTSAQASATYSNVSQASVVVFSQPTGTYTSAQTITLTDITAGASIYYTTDGSTPSAASTLYTGPITVSTTQTITAIATAPGLNPSQPLAQTYTINLGSNGISFTQGFAASTGLVILNGYATLNDSRLQLTNGISGEASSAWYYQPVNVSGFTTDFTFQLSNPLADGMTFAIQKSPQGTAAVGGNGSYLGYAPISNSIAIKFDLYSNAGEGPDSTGLYINGAVPTTPSIDLSSTGIDLHSDDNMGVHLTYDGTTLSMTITDMVTAATWSTSWNINIPTTIGSSTAYVGFTGGTGGQTASQKILTWSFTSSAGNPTAATPTFSPAAGTYTSAQNVTISDSSAGAVIYYTTNGATPTVSSSVYSGPITVSTSQTVKALAVAPGFSNSAVGSATYTINLTAAATPTFSPAAGTYTSAQNVTISDTTAGAVIYYTTNGTTPTTASTVYTGPVNVGATKTLKAIATATGFSSSAVGSAAYTINLPAATPTFSPAAGSYASAQTVTISDTTAGAVIYYTTNGTTPTTASSSVYSGPITVSKTQTVKAIAAAPGFSNSAVASAAYTISALTPPPTISVPSGTYNSMPVVTLSDSAAGATIYWTSNGTKPTTSSTVYTDPITISSAKTLQAIAVAPGLGTSTVASATYTLVAAAPVFSVAGGTYSGPVSLTLTTATPSGRIHYTTNNTYPTTSSPLYTAPIVISTRQTIIAMAEQTGYASSAPVTNTYNFTTAAATPTFSPGSGSYTSAQTVTISDATAGVTIYYTTNGTTPTASSAVYSGPITVSASQTVKAIAIGSGVSDSAVGSAGYNISAATPTVNFASGFTSTNFNLYGATISGGVLQLTDGGGGENRLAWYLTPVNVQAFTSDFNFQNTAAVADGFMFIIQNSANGVWALGGSGGNLGYTGIGSSVGIKFDIYNDGGEGADSTGFYVNGATPTLPSVDMTTSGVNLRSGNILHAHVTYDGTTLTLTITDTVTGASFTTARAINIPATVGSNTAYVGFTASTGALTAIQKILNWTYIVN